MPAINGSLIILRIEDPANPGTKVPITCQRDSSIDESVASIDTTCKDNDWKTVIGGEGSWSASLEMLYHPGDAIQVEIKRIFRARELIELEVWEDGVATEVGTALITGHNLSAPKQDVASRSLSLEGSGPLTAAA